VRAIVVGSVESTRVALCTISATPGWEVAALVTLPPSLAGRHSDFADLSGEAKRIGARVIFAPDANASEVLDEIRAMSPDTVFVIGWSQICRRPFLEAAGGRVVGYHPAPLPHLRGRAAIPWTILLNQPVTASTLFWLDEGVDSGPILAQKFFHVARNETATTLYGRHLLALETILSESLTAIAKGAPPRHAQDEQFATWAAKRTQDDGKIDWRQPTADVWRLIRAVTRPYPGAFTTLGAERLIIWSAHPWPDASRHMAAPGQVLLRTEDAFGVACGDGGGLWITEWETSSLKVARLHSHLGRFDHEHP
jgi:methionyl-tRNA formyltransferase